MTEGLPTKNATETSGGILSRFLGKAPAGMKPLVKATLILALGAAALAPFS